MQPPTDNPFTLINKPGPEENYIIGGPGCGKSRHLAELISGAGRGLNPIVISSNRTIAKEVAKLDPGFDQTRIGTIHSHCIRALGNPRLADDPEGILAWNEAHPRITLIPALDRDEIDLWERPVGTVHPGLLMNDYQRLRAARQPMPTDGPLADFARAWDSWRVSTRTLDSNDLLERCLEENIPAPGNSGCIFVDEAQDLTPLELALIRQWSSAGIPVVFAGDPNQNLYWWRGAESSALANLDDVPGTRTRILRQSHRVPRAIHRVTLDWMRECPTNPAIDYRPRDFAGGRWLSPSNWREPEQIIEAAEQLASGGQRGHDPRLQHPLPQTRHRAPQAHGHPVSQPLAAHQRTLEPQLQGQRTGHTGTAHPSLPRVRPQRLQRSAQCLPLDLDPVAGRGLRQPPPRFGATTARDSQC